MGAYTVGNQMSEDKEKKNTEILFKSADSTIKDEYLEYFATCMEQFLEMYDDAKMDGTEDGYRMRMVASTRLAQLGLSMFSFFGSAASVLRDGSGDSEACNAVAKVVSLMTEKKVDQWIDRAKKVVN